MLNDADFRERSADAIEELEELLSPVADREEFEVETGGGMMTLIFEEPSAAKFIISPNAPAKQIWVSALATSYKFHWDDESESFVLDKTKEPLQKTIAVLISKHLGKTITF